MSVKTVNVALVGLYSARYPAIGETHALSVLAGCINHAHIPHIANVDLFDMVGLAAESIEELIHFVETTQPDILGVSVTYGTFDFLKEAYGPLRRALSKDALVIFGGALASYLPDTLLYEIDGSALVVIGEGENAFVEIVRKSVLGGDIFSVAGITYLVGDQIKSNPRILTDVANLPPPFRAHIPDLHQKKSQIFLESSRGCSWASCTFCLRGLTDIKGLSSEYRNFTENRTIADLETLNSLGVLHVTFADEDFFGNSLSRAEYITDILTRYVSGGKIFSFDVSMTPHSIWTRKMAGLEASHRLDLLKKLKHSGLRKIFLGIESGSDSQLKRYAKGHKREDVSEIIHRLKTLNIAIEIGWIMLDPLCTMAELSENVSFLKENDLAKNTSYLFSEIRIQKNSSYFQMVKNYEKKTNCRILDDILDPNTLSYDFVYANSDVARIVDIIRKWSKRLHRVHYPIKNLSRFGSTGPLGIAAAPANEELLEFRVKLLDCFQKLTFYGVEAENIACRTFDYTVREFAERLLHILLTLDSAAQLHPRIQFAVKELTEVLEERS